MSTCSIDIAEFFFIFFPEVWIQNSILAGDSGSAQWQCRVHHHSRQARAATTQLAQKEWHAGKAAVQSRICGLAGR